MGPETRRLGALWVLLLILGSFLPVPAAATTYTVTEDWTKAAGVITSSAITDIAQSSDFTTFAVGTANAHLILINDTGGVLWDDNLATMDSGYGMVFPTDTVTKSIITTSHIYTIINSTLFTISPTTGAREGEYWNAGYLFSDLDATADGSVYAATSSAYLYIFDSNGLMSYPSGVYTSVDITDDGREVVASTTAGVLQSYQVRQFLSADGYANATNIWIVGSTGALSNYPVRFELSTIPGCTATALGGGGGVRVCLPPGSVKSATWNDIRFAAPAETVSSYYSHWVEEYDAYNASVWVKIPSILATPNGATVFMLWGKSGDTNHEDPANVFLFFDHFTAPSNKWYYWNSSIPTFPWWVNAISGSWWHLASNGGSGDWPSANTNNATVGRFYDYTAIRAGVYAQYHSSIGLYFTNQVPTVGDVRTAYSGMGVAFDDYTTHYITGIQAYASNAGTSNAATLNTTKPEPRYYFNYILDISRRGTANITYQMWAVKDGGPAGIGQPVIFNGTWSQYSYTAAGANPGNIPLEVRYTPQTVWGDSMLDWIAIRNVSEPEPVITWWSQPWMMAAGTYYPSYTSPPYIAWGSLHLYPYWWGLVDSKNTNNYIYDVNLDPTEAYVSYINGSYSNKRVYTKASGLFGATNQYASASGTPTTRVDVSYGASVSIEGRGAGIMDIIRLDGTRVGTYTAGGTVNGVAVARNGLWAVGGSTDGVVYFFSKASSSSWTLLYSTDPGVQVNRVVMENYGASVLAGRNDGSLNWYTITLAGSTPFTQTLHFSKDGSPAATMPLTVLNGGTDQTSWLSIPGAGTTTDAGGNFVFQASPGNYYQVTIDGQVSIFQTTAAYPTLYFQWTSPPAFPTYGSAYNATNGTIDTFYKDPLTVPITVEIKDTDTRAVAFCQTFTTDDLKTSWSPAAGNHHYQVRISAQRPMGAVGGVYYATTGTGPTMQILPIEGPALQILLMIFLMVVMGLFGYVHAPVGAFAVSLIAAWFNYETWLTIPWYWVQLTLLLSFMAMLARGADI